MEDDTTGNSASTANQRLLKQLEECTVRFQSTTPDHECDNTKHLSEAFTDANVIGLGEATHGTQEFFECKHRLIRWLVEDRGFRVIGFEANFAESLAIDDYVRRGVGDPVDALDATNFWTWYTEEVLALLEWLQEYNTDRAMDDRVAFYGFDAQFTSGAAVALREFFHDTDPPLLEDIDSTLALLEDEALRELDDIDDELARSSRLIGTVQDRIEAKRQEYETTTDPTRVELVEQHLRTLEQAHEIYSGRNNDDGQPWVARDEYMAENVSWILEYEDRDQIVLWAHNNHVTKAAERDGPETSFAPMGRHLERQYGDEYYTVGFDFGAGSFQAIADPEGDYGSGLQEFSVGWIGHGDSGPDSGSMDSENGSVEKSLHDVLAGIDSPAVFIDLDTAMELPDLSCWLSRKHQCHDIGAVFTEANPEERYTARDLPVEFDGYIFVSETNRARPID